MTGTRAQAGDTRLVTIEGDGSLASAMAAARRMADHLDFAEGERTLIMTVVAELARNIRKYAGRGSILLRTVEDGPRRGVEIVARDRGPGIPDTDAVLRDGFSTGGTLGLGLPGVKRMMDEFVLESKPGEGTTVTVRKWVAPRRIR